MSEIKKTAFRNNDAIVHDKDSDKSKANTQHVLSIFPLERQVYEYDHAAEK